MLTKGFWHRKVSFRTAEEGTGLHVEEMESKCTKLTLVEIKWIRFRSCSTGDNKESQYYIKLDVSGFPDP